MKQNSSLAEAKRRKNDEYYTRMEDIQQELKYYQDQWKDKVVYCNCDNPAVSNFWRYFLLNFDCFGLKGLIATYYELSGVVYQFEVKRDLVTNKRLSVIQTRLNDDGDFRCSECVALLKRCDIVVTNPPFSLFREYIAQLMQYEKKFLIIGSMNAITYHNIFALLQKNQMWIGYTKPKRFLHPDGVEKVFGNILWYTNLDIEKRHESLVLSKVYSPDKYFAYDNYDAINVDRVSDIPIDYMGLMGVPITFLEHYCAEQFEIVGLCSGSEKNLGLLVRQYDGEQHQINRDGSVVVVNKLNDGAPLIRIDCPIPGKICYEVNGSYYVRTYSRIFVKKKSLHEA